VFRRFFGEGGRPGSPTAQSLGSGVLVDPSGLVVTNNHVIEGMTDVKVALSDKREIPAKIILRDPRTDLAVLKLAEGSNFPVMELGDSDALEVGDLTLAIGNPFGVGQTVTQGIVSALARTQVGISDYGFFIQTDAAINPGNSGGPLVDMNARVVGINSAIFSKSGGSVGIGFAIPVNMVKIVIAAAKGGGKLVKRPWLGATLQTLSKDLSESLGLERPAGALIADMDPRGPAAEAGLKRGDVIVSVDGQSADDPEAVGYRLATKPLGGQATLGALRGSKKVAAQIRLAPAPENPPREPVTVKGPSPFAGATFVNISPAVSEEFSIQGVSNGVVISEIEEGSVAAELRLQKGDVVLAINDAKIASTRDMEQATSSRRYYWKITLARGGQVFTTVVGG
jgi:Do/DeqQ family serine protease